MWAAVIGALSAAGCADQAPAAPFAEAPAGITTLQPDGGAVSESGTDAVPAAPAPVAPAGALEITPAPALARARYHHAAALVVRDGAAPLVLVTGGEDGSGGALAHAERYDVTAGTWSEAGGNGAPSARSRHTATALEDGTGRVLVAGGHTGDGGPALGTAELYDPAADAFILVNRMSVPRTGHTATLLPDGRVLIAGGYDAAGMPLASCELFDPLTKSFQPCPATLREPRAHHAAALLPSGRVLVTGGLASGRYDPAIRTLDSAELWLAPGEVRPGNTMAAPRAEHTATVLPSGLVLLAGGSTHAPQPAARSDAEVFDAAAGPLGAFGMVTAPMATPRTGHTATLVPGSSVVLLIGGATEPHPELCPVTVGIERFVPDALGSAPSAPFRGVTETALFAEPLGPDGAPIGLPETAQGLTAHVATALPNGRILVAGGADCAFARPVAVARTALATDAAAAGE